MKNLILLIIGLTAADVVAQFKNNSFDSGAANVWPHLIKDWTNGGTQWVPKDYVTYEDPFIDLTGTGFGNGYYVEQSVYTIKGKKYKITFDLGTFYGWDLHDAGVTVSLDGVNLGNRIFHQEFTNSRDTFMRWKRLSTIEFNGTNSSVKVRITGNSNLVQSYGFNSGPGVIGLDNIALEELVANGAEANETIPFQIFPNPASDIIQIASNNPTQPISYSIFDLSGKSIIKSGLENNQIPVSSIPNGLYIIQLVGTEGTMMTRQISVLH